VEGSGHLGATVGLLADLNILVVTPAEGKFSPLAYYTGQ
jgi:hypothetical protein